MCGINGFYDLRHQYSYEERAGIVHAMNEKIRYRGPDSEGMYQDAALAMGMRRLAVLDLKSGNQPVYNEDRSLVIVYNGEIYNYSDLKKQLVKRGHQFCSATDTEVVLHAYEEYGTDAFRRLDGMFAFAIYDVRKKRLVLTRDCMGEKPLYYYAGRAFLWASELKSIMGTGIPLKQLDIQALNQYFQLRYIPAPRTIWQDVRKLRAGHYLTVDADGTVCEKEYWSLLQNKRCQHLSYRQAQQQLKALLRKSVRERMNSDVAVGALLSGGMDSGVIVSLMAEYSTRPVRTFTMGFAEKEYDERARARLIAEKYRTSHHEYELDHTQVLQCLDSILETIDEPFADSSLLPAYFISEFAGEHVKVILTGDAGDELFLGYSRYLIGYYSRLLCRLPKWLRDGFARVVYALPDQSVKSRQIRKVLHCCGQNAFEQYQELVSLGFKEEERQKLLKKQYFSKDCMAFLKERYDAADGSTWKKVQYTDLTTVLEGDMLVKMDRMSMLHSLETRTPLLSKEIVEFAFSLPDAYKIRGKTLKRIFKSTFADVLPENYTKLPKSGFGIPLDDWFRKELKDWVRQKLNPKKLEQDGILNGKYVNRILKEHFSGRVNRKEEIWALLVFQTWYEREGAAA